MYIRMVLTVLAALCINTVCLGKVPRIATTQMHTFGAPAALGADAPEALRAVRSLQTPHYDLHIEALDEAEIAALVESVYQHLARVLGEEPAGRMFVGVHLSQASYSDAVVAAHGPKHRLLDQKSGGIAGSPPRCYMRVHPNVMATRQNLAYFVGYQYVRALRTRGGPVNNVSIEHGLAEICAAHSWSDGAFVMGRALWVHGGRTFDCAQEQARDYGVTSLRNVAEATELLKDQGDEAWGLVAFLCARKPEVIRQWSSALVRGAKPMEIWDSAFSIAPDKILAEYTAWLRTVEPQFTNHRGLWQQVDRSIQGMALGRADPSLLLVRSKCDSLSGRMRLFDEIAEPQTDPPDVPIDKTSTAGLVVSYNGVRDFIALGLWRGGDAATYEVRAGIARDRRGIGALAAADEYDIALNWVDDDTVAVSVNGKEVHRVPCDERARFGFWIKDGRASFSDISIDGKPLKP